MKKSKKNVKTPEITGEATHARPISPSILKLIFLAPLYKPIPRIQPTMTCELETGTIGIGGSPIRTKKSDNAVDEKINNTSA